MTGDPAFHRSRPHGGTISIEAPPAVVPALAWLRKATNSAEAMKVLTRVPEHLWPIVALHSAQRHYINRESLRTVLEMVGARRLETALGKTVALRLTASFSKAGI